jgi:polynucleotide 5'-hydroxyl-kinase GRC3/NOL9
VFVIGETDTGKSTFARYLFSQIVQTGLQAAFLDGDPGQSTLGPPGTLSLVVSAAGPGEAVGQAESRCGRDRFFLPQGFPAPAVCRRSFVGSVSPHGHFLEMLLGAERLVAAAREAGAQAVVYDTCGLVDMAHGGYTLKLAKIELLRPATVLGIQRQHELEPLFIPLLRSGKAEVVRLSPSVEVRSRSRGARQSFRVEGFERYFSGCGSLTLDWMRLAVFPFPHFTLNRLIALEDAAGYTLGLGLARDIDREARRLVVLTPLSSLEGVRAIRLGSMTVDPETFEGRMIELPLR